MWDKRASLLSKTRDQQDHNYKSIVKETRRTALKNERSGRAPDPTEDYREHGPRSNLVNKDQSVEEIGHIVDEKLEKHHKNIEKNQKNIEKRQKNIEKLLEQHLVHGDRGAGQHNNTTTREHGNLQQEYEALAKRSDLLQADNDELARMNRELQTANDGYATKLLAVQPRRRELLPSAAGDKFRALIDGIEIWVTEWVYKIVEDKTSEMLFLERVKKHPERSARFSDIVKRDADLSSAAACAECEVEVLSSFIFKFLQEDILGRAGSIYGAASPGATFIVATAEAMAKRTDPQREPPEIRAWLADTYQAMIASPETQERRRGARKEMAETLADYLCFLVPPGGDQDQEFLESLEADVIEPAFRLQESFVCSPAEYLFSQEPTGDVDRRVHACRDTAELARILDSLDMRNVAQRNKKIGSASLAPETSAREFAADFRGIATLFPALVSAGTSGEKGGPGEDKAQSVVEKQRMLVSWTPSRQPPRQGVGASWIHKIIQMNK